MSKSFEDYLNTPDNSMMYDTQDIEENKPWAILSYIAVLWILPLFVNGGCSKFGRAWKTNLRKYSRKSR